MSAISGTTESADVISAFHDALPRSLRTVGNRGHVQDKLADLYRHWRQVDLAEAAKNLLQNEIEDRMIGVPASRIKKLNPELFPDSFRGGQTGMGRNWSDPLETLNRISGNF